ncbi:MAG: bifunctional phosphopantothenoylcysteine decarboxylase/phosphopantothenate--cysteine ligase CoaBC [Hyphomicrobiales bacterium]
MLNQKHILLILTGGIAAYKCLDLIRRLRERGATVRCVMTKSAAEFVTPLSVQALSENPVYDDLFDLTQEDEIGHIKLSREADLVVVAPASADFLAKMANGLAGDLAGAVLLATDKPVLVAPAMNPFMWNHAATQRNVAQLKEDGIRFIGPETGEMAEKNEAGRGRLSEPLEIVAAIEGIFSTDILASKLTGKKVLITAGPTHEPIDPVRYIANRSSGKQGYAIAEAFVKAGASVTLVSGPVNLTAPQGVTLMPVETAQQMQDAVKAALPADIAIMAAAVADWRVDGASVEKIKKDGSGDIPPLSFTENPDILKHLSHSDRRPALVVGFAAETQKVIEHATAKLGRKGADMIVANDVSSESAGGIGVMGGDENIIHLITKDGHETWDKMSKKDVADRLVDVIAAKVNK